MRANIQSVALDLSSGKLLVTLSVERAAETVLSNFTQDQELEVTMKKYSPKRSTNANAYMWTLLGELASAVGSTANELYISYICDYGEWTVSPVQEDIADMMIQAWGEKGIGYFAEKMPRDSKLKGYVNIIFYFGTHLYTKDKFSALLEQIVDDCKDQGIDTRPPEEIASLVEAYYANEKHTSKTKALPALPHSQHA